MRSARHHRSALFLLALSMASPTRARADDLSGADLASIDRALAAAGPGVCAEPSDQLRSLRDAYARQQSPVVRSAIAARVPMVLDTLRFCIETSGPTPPAVDAIAPARQALAAARTRAECSVPAAGIEQLVAAWEGESSAVVRGALEARLESLGQTVRFCLETLGPAAVTVPAEATPVTPRVETVTPPVETATVTPPGEATSVIAVEATPLVEAMPLVEAPTLSVLPPIAPLPARVGHPGGRALGSPFRP